MASTYSVLSEAEVSRPIESHIPAAKSQEQAAINEVEQPFQPQPAETIDRKSDVAADQVDVVDPGGQALDKPVANFKQEVIQHDKKLDQQVEKPQHDDVINQQEHQSQGDGEREKQQDLGLNEVKQEAKPDSEKEKPVATVDEKAPRDGRLEPPAPQAPDEAEDKEGQVDINEKKEETRVDVANVDGKQAIKPVDQDLQLAAPVVEKTGKVTKLDEGMKETRSLTVNRDLKTAGNKDDDDVKAQARTSEVKKMDNKDSNKEGMDEKSQKVDTETADTKKAIGVKEDGVDQVKMNVAEKTMRHNNPITEGRTETRIEAGNEKPLAGVEARTVNGKEGREIGAEEERN